MAAQVGVEIAWALHRVGARQRRHSRGDGGRQQDRRGLCHAASASASEHGSPSIIQGARGTSGVVGSGKWREVTRESTSVVRVASSAGERGRDPSSVISVRFRCFGCCRWQGVVSACLVHFGSEKDTMDAA